MKRAFLSATLVLLAAASFGQPRGGILRVTLTNGTDGGPGTAEKVTLFRLSAEMVPVKALGSVSGSFEITDIEVEGQRPMLLQVSSSGVNYNQPINFGRGYEAEAEITVFDAFREWDDAVLEVTTSRVLYRREGDKLLVDEVFVVENRTSPPRTYHDPDGTFRFNLPTEDLLELHSVSASSPSGMPVPQQASPMLDGRGYVTKTAFKPGETQIAVSYEVGYRDGNYTMTGEAFYPLDELLVFVAPPDIQVEADGWDQLGVEPEGRFAAIRRSNVVPGTPIRLELSGGSARAEDLVTSSGGSSSAEGSRQAASSGTIERIPDPTRASKWFIVVLMAAAMGYALLAKLYPPPPGRG